jgi:hypothetical protein
LIIEFLHTFWIVVLSFKRKLERFCTHWVWILHFHSFIIHHELSTRVDVSAFLSADIPVLKLCARFFPMFASLDNLTFAPIQSWPKSVKSMDVITLSMSIELRVYFWRLEKLEDDWHTSMLDEFSRKILWICNATKPWKHITAATLLRSSSHSMIFDSPRWKGKQNLKGWPCSV